MTGVQTCALPICFSGFSEVIFLTALFEETLLYNLWTHISDVKFNTHRYFEESIKRDVHTDRGHLISIGHVLDEEDYASHTNLERNIKTGRCAESVTGERVIDKAIEIVSNYFKGIGFLLQVNGWTGYHGTLKDTLPSNCTLLSGAPHGQNRYQHINAIAALSVTNPQRYQKNWIQERTGLSDDEIYQAYRIHNVYQSVGRTSVRDFDSDEPIIFLTAGYEDAQLLHKLFKGSTFIGQIGSIPKMKGREIGRASCRERV